jgi:hypothetical protein
MVIFDEASGIDDAIWAVTAGFFTENTPNRFWLAFSNPRRNTGYFYETFHSKREFWHTKVVDARTVEGTDKQVYQQIIDEYGPTQAKRTSRCTVSSRTRRRPVHLQPGGGRRHEAGHSTRTRRRRS